ncbi:MAG: sodium:solute symporter family protein [Chloroflexi bacterium]|nr:sodium:solute symporter family protein [Chloroflexota bacterium]
MSAIHFGIIGYLLVVAIVAYVGRRKTVGVDGFLVAGRKMPIWVASFSLAATLIGTGVTIGVGEMAYQSGLSAILYPVALALALGISMWLAAARFREGEYYTLPEMCARFYGRKSRYVLAVSSTLRWIGPIAAQFVAIGAIVSTLTGWPIHISIVLSAGLTIGYTVLGGIWAVSLTDVIQLVVVYLGLVLLMLVTMGRYGDMFTIVRDLPPVYSSWDGVGVLPLTAWLGSLMMIAFIDQPWMQLCASVRTPKCARKAGLIAAALVLPIGFISVYTGLLARLTSPGLDPRMAVSSALVQNLDPLIAALAVAAIVAAGMSCADSWLHSSSTVVVKDLYQELVDKNASEGRIHFVSMLATLVLGLMSLGLALIWQGGIIMLVMLTGAWASVVYIGPVLVAWFSPRKILPNVGLGLMVLVLVVGTLILVRPPYVGGVHPNLSVTLIAFATTAVAVLLPWTSYRLAGRGRQEVAPAPGG